MSALRKMKKFAPLLMGVSLYAAPVMAQTAPAVDPAFTQAIADIQSGWDNAKYQTPDKDAQIKAITTLETKAAAAVNSYPQRAEPLIWEGIIYSTDAGLTGGMDALPKVKKAKELFEKALTIDAKAMNGGAYTSLGSLYYMVPGWPIAFGNDAKAEQNLKTALSISPDDIDANYFYGDFLIHKKQYTKAVPVLEHALKAPARAGRDIADAGRRQEAQADLDKAKKMQNKDEYN